MQEEIIQYQKDTITESGTVKVSELSSQTGGDAEAGDILKGKTAWVNGIQITGTIDDYSDKTVEASEVTSDGTTTTLKIPQNGYYNTSSKIQISNDDLNNDFRLLDYKMDWKGIGTSPSSYTVSWNVPVEFYGKEVVVVMFITYKEQPKYDSPNTSCDVNGLSNPIMIYSYNQLAGFGSIYIYSGILRDGSLSCSGPSTTEREGCGIYILGI